MFGLPETSRILFPLLSFCFSNKKTKEQLTYCCSGMLFIGHVIQWGIGTEYIGVERRFGTLVSDSGRKSQKMN
jgi:hypothetical protein